MTHINSFIPPVSSPLRDTSPLLPSLQDPDTLRVSFPASGPLPIPMTNDYLFRALLQRNNNVLKGLICSLLHLSPEQMCTAEITNPIELGTSVTDKTFILDIKVLLNDHTVLNLELQVINQHNWVERSLSYLCRNFDNLQSGDTYQNIRPVLQIGILNFTLFPEQPEFYATYQLLNVKNHSLYSDKLRISVLNLTQIELATKEDKSCQIDAWANLFKATTWEELTMLAQNNEYIKEAADTIFRLCQDERVRMECQAREDHYRTQLGIQQMMDRQAAEIQSRNAEIEAQAAEIQSQNAEIKTQAAEIDKLKTWIKAHGYDPADI